MFSQGSPFSILQVNTTDGRGGAARVAWNLFNAYRRRGYSSWLAVGRKQSNDPQVLPIQNDLPDSLWSRAWSKTDEAISPLVGKVRGVGLARSLLRQIGQPTHILNRWQGVEDFDFPGSWKLLEHLPERPDLVHCHNLHGGYFDLRVLSTLSAQVPLILTLHDAWLLSGHCAHSFECDRWMIGCGHCPDLTIYPAIQRDATSYNWERKHEIFRKSRLYIATPSLWLMRKVERSMLMAGVVDLRVIPNGVDLSVFRPADKLEARRMLGLPLEGKILLSVAPWIRSSSLKDYATMRAVVARLSERFRDEQVLFLALGEHGSPERIGGVELRFIPYQENPETVARYYQAADVYMHAARAETFPNAIVEALACGTPVVAMSVGGISEQVENGHTGLLVQLGDSAAMASCIERFFRDEELRLKFAINAAEIARRRFDLNVQVEAYLRWYEQIMEKDRGWRKASFQ